MATTPDPFNAYRDPRDNEPEALRLIRAIHAAEPPQGVTLAPWSGRPMTLQEEIRWRATFKLIGRGQGFRVRINRWSGRLIGFRGNVRRGRYAKRDPLSVEWDKLLADFRRQVYGADVRFRAAAAASASARAKRAKALEVQVASLYSALCAAPNLKAHRRAGMIARLLQKDVQHVRAILRRLGLARPSTSPSKASL
jgi:hypothetical protein